MGSSFRFWSALVCLLGVMTGLLVLLGAPSPALFGGVLAGAIVAARHQDPAPFPEPVRHLGVALIGTGAGAMIDGAVVDLVLAEPVAVLGGVVGTLLVSMAVGQILRLSPHVNGPTAVLASIAGGASGVSAVARELAADDRIVLAVQYLRVLFVLATVPIAASIFGATSSAAGSRDEPNLTGAGLAFAVVSVALGLALARVVRFSASRLVLPLAVAIVLSVGEVFPDPSVPPAVLAVGYACVGLTVGLSLTRPTLRVIAKLMPLALLQVVLGMVACALVGVLFAEFADVPRLDAYLATTPGGLPAVTAIALDSGAGVGLIVTMQLVRIVLSLLLAPVVGKLIRRAQGR